MVEGAPWCTSVKGHIASSCRVSAEAKAGNDSSGGGSGGDSGGGGSAASAEGDDGNDGDNDDDDDDEEEAASSGASKGRDLADRSEGGGSGSSSSSSGSSGGDEWKSRSHGDPDGSSGGGAGEGGGGGGGVVPHGRSEDEKAALRELRRAERQSARGATGGNGLVEEALGGDAGAALEPVAGFAAEVTRLAEGTMGAGLRRQRQLALRARKKATKAKALAAAAAGGAAAGGVAGEASLSASSASMASVAGVAEEAVGGGAAEASDDAALGHVLCADFSPKLLTPMLSGTEVKPGETAPRHAEDALKGYVDYYSKVRSATRGSSRRGSLIKVGTCAFCISVHVEVRSNDCHLLALVWSRFWVAGVVLVGGFGGRW